MTLLYDLATKYNTNKGWHGYTSFYEKLFQENRTKYQHFFEIGIDQGASLFAWRDYFPNSIIYGIDINIPDSVVNKERIVFAKADQSDEFQLLNVVESWDKPSFDCILDDGSHFVSMQRISIETLWQFVKKGGYYIIEDLHTNIRALHHIHPHMGSHAKFIDESPTVHDKIMNTMAGSKTEFNIPFEEIDEIIYYNNPHTMSLTCAFKKK